MEKEFLYKIGQDCWMVQPGYGKELYRVFVKHRIIDENEKGITKRYRVEEHNSNAAFIECEEKHLFDVTTRCNDALCVLYNRLSNKRKNIS